MRRTKNTGGSRPRHRAAATPWLKSATSKLTHRVTIHSWILLAIFRYSAARQAGSVPHEKNLVVSRAKVAYVFDHGPYLDLPAERRSAQATASRHVSGADGRPAAQVNRRSAGQPARRGARPDQVGPSRRSLLELSHARSPRSNRQYRKTGLQNRAAPTRR